MLVAFSLESNVFVLHLSDNLGLCSAYNKCYLVRPRLDPLTACVVLICLFVSQWIWLSSDHMFYIYCAGNSSVSQFSKGVGSFFLCVCVWEEVLSLPRIPRGPEQQCSQLSSSPQLHMLPCRRLAGVPVF